MNCNQQPTLKTTSDCQTEEKYRSQFQQSNGISAFKSAGFGGPEPLRGTTYTDSQHRLSDYRPEVEDYQNQQYRAAAANDRNQTGQDLYKMRHY